MVFPVMRISNSDGSYRMMKRRISLFLGCIGVVVATMLLSICVSQASAQIVGPLSWQAPVLADRAGGLEAISCPSLRLCVATDASGDVVTSTDPSGGARAWRVAHVDNIGESCALVTCKPGLSSISCPSVSLCVAVDPKGSVYWTTDLEAGAAGWNNATISNPNPGLNAVSCPTTSLCVAVQDEGDVTTSTDPTAGASAWHAATIDSGQSCRPGDCAAIGKGPEEPPIDSISCPSASLCVAGDWDGNVLSSTDPTDGSDAWGSAYVDGNVVGGHHDGLELQTTIDSVSCSSTSLCFASDEDGYALTSENPDGGASAWKLGLVSLGEFPLAGGGDQVGRLLFGLTCPSGSLCLALEGHIPLFAQGMPSTSELALTEDAMSGKLWVHGVIDRVGRLEAIACPSASFCVAVDSTGHVVVGKSLTNAQIRPLLHVATVPRHAPSLRSLLRNGSFGLEVKVPLAGEVVIHWLVSSSGRTSSDRAVVASGRYVFPEAASEAIPLRLTRLGRAILRQRNHVRVTAQLSFSSADRRPVTTIGTFLLRP
jgi:hypothetical protein